MLKYLFIYDSKTIKAYNSIWVYENNMFFKKELEDINKIHMIDYYNTNCWWKNCKFLLE